MCIENTFHTCACMCTTHTIENTFYVYTSPSRAIIDGIFCFPAADSLLPSSFSPPLPPPPPILAQATRHASAASAA